MNIRIQVEDRISQSLKNLQRIDEPAIRQQLAFSAAEHLRVMADRSFANSGSDFGPWAPRKDSKTHRLLQKTTLLRRSLRATAEASGAAVVSDRKYAGFHQFGTRKMVARPFVPVSPDGRLSDRAERLIIAKINAKLRSLVPGLPPA